MSSRIAARKTSITSGLSGSPADTRRRSAAGRPAASEARLAIMRYSVGDWQRTATLVLGDDREALFRIEAGVVQQARGARRPRRDERVARRLGPAARGGAPRELACARAQPVLRLHRLAAQIPLRVHDAARLARGAGREDQQRRVGRRGVGDIDAGSPPRAARRRRRPRAWRVLGVSDRALELGHVGSRGEHEGRGGALHPEGDVLGAAAAPSRAATTAPRRHAPSIAKTHSGRAPIRVITTSPRPTPCLREPGRGLGGLPGDLGIGVGAHGAAGRDRAQRLVARPLAREALDHVAREVEAVRGPAHGAGSVQPLLIACRTVPAGRTAPEPGCRWSPLP